MNQTKKYKKWLGLMLGAMLMLTGCSARTNSDTIETPSASDTTITQPSDNSTTIDFSSTSELPAEEEDPNYSYDGVATYAPYVIYNADGTRYEYESGQVNQFDNMFVAIKACGKVASNKNKCYVEDANGTLVFKRSGNTKCWIYDGTHVVGEKALSEGKAYATQHARAYVVNGVGSSYVALGIVQCTERSTQTIYAEMFSGGYSYLYTPQGCASGSEWSGKSYAYGSTYLRLSEATYKDISEEGGGAWNGYAFFNIASSSYNCDLGIGTYAGGGGAWKITANCSNDEHLKGTADQCVGFYTNANGVTTYDSVYSEYSKSSTFVVWQDYVVTTMKKGADGVYSGADDLFMEAFASENSWGVVVTNLRTNEKWGYTHTHEGLNTTQSDYLRVLLAASYCPVDGDLWNARDGGYLKNVLFEDTRVAKYQEDGDYSDVEKEIFYPGNEAFIEGFTQAADCAALFFGTTDVAGTWKSGKDKIVGANWISFSSYYDGSHM